MPEIPNSGVAVGGPTEHPGQYQTKELIRLALYYLGANGTLPASWQRELVERLKDR